MRKLKIFLFALLLYAALPVFSHSRGTATKEQRPAYRSCHYAALFATGKIRSKAPRTLANDEGSFVVIGGEKMDCVNGTTYELIACACYISDSLHQQLDSMYTKLLSDLDNEIKVCSDGLAGEDIELEDVIKAHLKSAEEKREWLITSQKYFLKYAAAEKELVGKLTGGREQSIHQNYTEIALLESRIATVQHYFSF